MDLRLSILLIVTLGACGKTASLSPNAPAEAARPSQSLTGPSRAPSAAPDFGAVPATAPASLSVRSVPLPGITGPVTLDYIVADRAHARVWIPVGEPGSVFVFDVGASTFSRVDGFKTRESEVRGKKRTLGPSAATVGDGFVYVGDRASGEVCAVDEKTLTLGACLRLPTPSDGLAYVALAKEVWATTPKDRSLTILDASRPEAVHPKLVVKTDGAPEGYAVDETRELFYTNLEDADRTLVVDVKTHAIVSTWNPECGEAGPRGIAVDGPRRLVLVACTDSVHVLDGAHEGARLGTLYVGAGVDNIEYVASRKLVYVAASKAAHVTVARLDDSGQLSVVAAGPTAEGGRNAVVDAAGNIYVVDARTSNLLVFAPPLLPRP